MKNGPLRRKVEVTWVLVVVLGIVGFYGEFIRPGVTWADDWASYLQGALNILHGNRYSATGYIFNPDIDIGPTSYPPLYPLALALPIAVLGTDFDTIRQYQLTFWAIFLCFVYSLGRLRLNMATSSVLLLAVGLSPYLFQFKDYIASESLFLAFLFILSYTVAQLDDASTKTGAPIGRGALLGVLLALCIATRSVGLVLIPSILAYDVVRFRQLRGATAIAVAIATASFIIQTLLVDFFDDYMANFELNRTNDLLSVGLTSGNNLFSTALGYLIIVPLHLKVLVGEFSRFWGQGANGAFLPRLATIVFGCLAIFGFYRTFRREVMFCDVFAALYSMTLLVIPPKWASTRMAMPLLPLFYIYMLIGASDLKSGCIRPLVLVSIAGLGALTYIESYRGLQYRQPLDGIYTTDFRGMFDYIKSNTKPGDAIIFDKPRTLALYTHHRAAAVYNTRQGDALLSYMRAINARYLLFYVPMEPPDYLKNLLCNNVNKFEQMYESGGYTLYRLK